MKWLLSLFLVTFVVAQAPQWPIDRPNYSLEPGTRLLLASQANLKTVANLTLTHTAAIQICFQEHFPVPANVSYWSWTCTHHFTYQQAAPGTIEAEIVPLRNSLYNIGIYFANPTQTQADTISFTLNGDTCPDGQIFNSVSCVTPTKVTPDDIVTANFTSADSSQVFFFEIPQLIGSILVEPIETLHPLEFSLRRAGAPGWEDDQFDGEIGEVAEFNFPRPGTYYLVVNSTVPQTVTFNISLENCAWADHAAGPGCRNQYNHDDADAAVTGVEGEYVYWVVLGVSPSKPFRVSVAAQDGDLMPHVYASRGNIPQEGNAEISNCNVKGCNSVNTIEWIATTNETWFIAVTPAPGGNGTVYGIWFGSVCYPGCDATGSCVQDGPDTGYCTCNDPEDKGVACQITSRLGEQYVVLGAIWGTALGMTVLVLVIYFMTSQKTTYEQL